MTSPRSLPPGIELRLYERRDGTQTETYTVRIVGPGGARPRRSFDTLDYQARHRSARRWRPEELRQEHAGRKTLGDFFATWWVDHAMVELKRSTLSIYRCLWEAHAEPRLATIPMREIDAPLVVRFRGELPAASRPDLGGQNHVHAPARVPGRDRVRRGGVQPLQGGA